VLSRNDLPRPGPLRLPEDNPGAALLRRIGLAIGLICGVALLLWIDRDGLRDNAHGGRTPDFVDIFYFTVVSLTTVGYGDITPITNESRLVNAVLLTPIRIFLWVLFLGTAYEVTVLRLGYRQERQMRELRERLRNHVIVCGYGLKGRTIVNELLAHHHAPDEIVAIDPTEEAMALAVKQGLVALKGDASSESLLRAAAVEHAACVLIATNRDDSAVLIALTVCNLAPHVRVIAAAREEENVKLLYRAGVSHVVTPSASGGRLMAAAVDEKAVPKFLDDLLMFGEGLSVEERTVRADEAGKAIADLADLREALVLGVARGNERTTFNELDGYRVQPGDVVVYITGGSPAAEDEPPPASPEA
jgi:voltage-gated potassium channel